ncbi:MAG TPA: TIGR03619 family F420-dependent LLM class oxidoreductase [Acidimicrobiales bacterium]
MRFGVALPHANTFADPDALTGLARRLEAAGFDSLWVSDHVIVPEGHGYIPEVMAEPLAVLAHLGAVTERVTLGTSVLIAPYRNPVFTAAFLASVDVFCKGRLVVGVGVGWMPEEFEALSVPFEERGPRTDECIRVWNNLWTTDTSSFDGHWTHYDRMRMFPKSSPLRDGKIPVWVGGNTPLAIRRAALLGDGWHPINLSPEDVAAGVGSYRTHCEADGRPVGPVCLRHMPGGRTSPGARFEGTPDQQASDIQAYAAAGCDELMLSWFARTPDELGDKLEGFLRDVVPLATA